MHDVRLFMSLGCGLPHCTSNRRWHARVRATGSSLSCDDVPQPALPNIPQGHHDAIASVDAPTPIRSTHMAYVRHIACSVQRGNRRDVLCPTLSLRAWRYCEGEVLPYEHAVQTHQSVRSHYGHPPN